MGLEVNQEFILQWNMIIQKMGFIDFHYLVLLIFFVIIFHSAKLPSIIIFSCWKLYELPWAEALLSQETWSRSTCAGTHIESKILI